MAGFWQEYQNRIRKKKKTVENFLEFITKGPKTKDYMDDFIIFRKKLMMPVPEKESNSYLKKIKLHISKD